MQGDVLVFAYRNEHIREAGEVIARELSVERNPEAGSAGGDAGRTDRPHSEAGVVQERRKSQRAFVFAKTNGHDLRIATSDIESGVAQPSTQKGTQRREIGARAVGCGND